MPLLALWAGQLPAGTFGVYGPETFVRTDSEQPDVFSATFPVFNPDTTYTLKIYNGGIKGSGTTGTQSSSTELALNGEVIELPDDFKRKKNAFFSRPVTLLGSNELSIMLGGKPRSVVTLEIDGVDNDPPVITATVDVPANAAGWNNTDVRVSFTCSDVISDIASCPQPVTVTGEGASQVISGTAVDNAGNTATASVTLNIDKTPPVLGTMAVPLRNAAGWNNTDVTVSFQATDALSGVASVSGPVTLTGEGAGQVVGGSATDLAGNTSTASVTLNIDKTPPVISAAAAPPPNPSGWNNTDVTVSFSATDTLSGVVDTTNPIVVAGEAASQVITGSATDAAGNKASASVSLNIDKTPPSITTSTAPPANTAGWNNSDVTVSFNATDALSGVATVPGPVDVSNEGANQFANGSATDVAGNTAMTSVSLNIDKTAPTIAAVTAPPPNTAGWNNTDVTVSFEVTDALSGIEQVTAPVVVSNDGADQSIGGEVTDVAGNTATTSATVSLDKTPPTLTAATTPPPNAAGWNNADVTVSFAASDALSGVAAVTDPVIVSNDVADEVIGGEATDVAGNTTTTSATVSLDKTPPAISIGGYADGDVVGSEPLAIQGMATDENQLVGVTVNGVAAALTGDSFASSVPLAEGSNTIAAIATDIADNTATASLAIVLVTNKPPVLAVVPPQEVAEAASLSVTVSATDEDGDELSFTADTLPGFASLTPLTNSSATLQLAPGYGDAGEHSFVLSVSDGKASDSQAVTVRVTNSNRLPELSVALNHSVSENAQLTITATATDPDGESLTYSVSGLPAFGSLTDNGDGTATITLAPGFDAAGQYPVTLVVTDAAGGSRSAGLTIVVNNVNRQPAILSQPVLTATDGSSYSYQVVAEDPDADLLQFTLSVSPQGMGINPSTGQISWIPGRAQVGQQDVSVKVSDGQGGEAVQTYRVEVLAGPDREAPIVELLVPQEVVAGGILSVAAIANDDSGVVKVSFYIDELLAGEVTAAPYRFDFNAPDQTGPPVGVRAVALDAAGNTGEDAATVTVVEADDVTLPVIRSVIAPASAAAGESVSIIIDAFDERGIQEIRIGYAGSSVATLNAAPYETVVTLPANAAAGTELVYTVTAADGAGNTAAAEARITVDAALDSTPPGPVSVQAPATAVPGQVVPVSASAVDDSGILKVVFLANDVPFQTALAPPYSADLKVPAVQPVGSQIQVTAIATDFSGNATTSGPAVVLVVEAGEAQLAGEVFDDATGLPLADAMVRVTPLAAAVTDARGRFVMGLQEGPAVVTVQRGGYTPVTRQLTLLPGVVNRVLDFRLTPMVPPVSVDPRTGTVLAVAPLNAEVRIPAGALAAMVDMHATPVSGQGLRARLPAGWAPVGAFHLGPESVTFSNPVSVSFAGVNAGVIAARWDTTRNAWVRLSLADMADRKELVLEAPGGVALLRPDTSPAIPPMPAPGEVISGVNPVALPADASALLSPSPYILFMQPGARSSVQVQVHSATAVPSGTPLVVDFTETYRRTDGSRLVPPPSSQDILLFQTGAGFAGGFIASPSEVFDPALLAEGVIHLEASSGEAGVGRAILGAGGGTVTTADGITLILPPGALGSNTAVTLATLPGLPAGFVNAGDFEWLAGVEIDLGPGVLSLAATLQLQPDSALPAGARVLAARAVRVNDNSRLELVGIGTAGESGVEITTGALGLPLPGIDRSGRYYLFMATTPPGYVTGTVTGGAIAPGRVLAESAASDFVSLVDSSAIPYVLALPAGDSQVQASDLDKGRNTAGTASIAAADDIVTLDLVLGDARPTVVQVIPASGATGVATTSSVTLRFSRPMDASTLTSDTVSLLTGAGPVAGSVSLSADAVTAVFQPARPLAIETLHTLVLAAGIRDQFGGNLLGNRPDETYAVSFTTLDPTPPARPEAGQISSSPPDGAGNSIINGTQGTVEPGTVVTVENLTTGVSVSTLGQVDGSFSLSVQAGLTDDLDMLLIDQAGNQTRVELGRVTPPAGTGVIGPEGSLVQNEEGQAVIIPPGTVPGDTIVSITPLDISGVVLPFSEAAPGVVGGAVTVSMPGVELAEIMELHLSLEGVPGSTITDLVPLYAIDTDIELPADLVPGTELNLQVIARDKLGQQTELVVPLPIVATSPDTTLRTEIVNETPVVSLTLPAQAMPGQVIHVEARAQPPDIKVQFPADAALTGNEQLIVYEVREVAGRSFLDLADTASFKVLEDGRRVIETNSPPYRGIRRDTSNLLLAIYTNEIISFAQVISDVTALSGGGLAGASIALADSMSAQFNETIVGVSMLQAYSRPRPADVSLYEFAVVPVIADTPTTITLIDLDTNNVLAEARIAALPPGSFSSVVILGEDESDPVVTGTTSFKNDAVPVDAGIDVIFSHKVDTASLKDNLYLEDSTGKRIPVNFVYLDENDTETFIVKVVPEESFKAGERYKLVATTGIKRPNGKSLGAQFALNFTAGGSGQLLGSLTITEADSFDVIGTTAVVTARSIDGTTNSLFTVDLTDPAKPVVLAERKFNLSIDGGVRAVRALQDVALARRDGGLFQGDLAIVSIGSTDTFSAVRLYDISDPTDPVFLSGTLVGTPTQTIQDSASIVVIPNFDDFTATEVFDPNQGLLDGIPDVQTIPWLIDASSAGTAWFINNGIGLMTLNLGRAIPPPPRAERGSQLGPSYPPEHKSGALVIVDDPALVRDDGNFKITQPAMLQISDGEKIRVGGTIDSASGSRIAQGISRILVNGFEAPIQRDQKDMPVSFGTKGNAIFEIPLHEGYNIITATAYDKAGVPLGSLQVAAGRKYSANPLDQSGEVHTSLEPIQIGSTTVTLTASVDDPLRFDAIFVNGEAVSEKTCPINVNQRTSSCGWSGSGDITLGLQPGANTIMATAIDVDQNPFEEENDREFIGLSFYDLRVTEDVAAAVYNDGLHLFQAGSLARMKLLDIPNAFRLTLAPQILTDKDKDGRMGIPENDDSDTNGDITVFDELRNLALVGTGNQGKLVFADITEPHKAEVVGSIDFTQLAGNVKAGAIYRAAIDPEGVLAYVAAGDRILTVDITRPDGDTSGNMDARVLGALPLDDQDKVVTLPGARDLRLDTQRGMLYVLQKDVGLAVVAINICSRDAGVDATRRPATRITRNATLENEREALRKGIRDGLATAVCTNILKSPKDVALLSQGSSACLWRKDKLCSTAYQPGLSDHDFELIINDQGEENSTVFKIETMTVRDDNGKETSKETSKAALCAEQIEKKIKEQELMQEADLSVFPVRRSLFEYAYRDVNPRPANGELICGGGDDPTADLCLGRNGLMLKWLLEGEWVTKDDANTIAYDGGIDLSEALARLRSPIDKNSEKFSPGANGEGGSITKILVDTGYAEQSHIPLLEGKEWACLQDFNLNASGARLRVVSTGLGNVKIQVPVFRKQVQKAGKAGIRAVFGKLLSTPEGNAWALRPGRRDYNAYDGCYTAIDDPDAQVKTIDDFWYKRCESFEEFVASRALLSVKKGMGIFTEQEALSAYEFFRRKADVGSQITDEVEANEFISSVMDFIAGLQGDQDVTDTYNNTVFKFGDTTARISNLNRCEDEHIPDNKPGGENFKLKQPVRLYNGGYAAIPATELGVFHDGSEIQRDPVAPLAPGASRYLTLKLAATGDGDPHAVQFRLDPDDTLVEYDKANNFDGLWYYYLQDTPNTMTAVPATAGRSEYDGSADPRPRVPTTAPLPDPAASGQCLIDSDAPPSPAIELISTIDGQLEYVGQAGDMVEVEWVIRNLGNETLNGVMLDNPLLDQPINLGSLCGAYEAGCTSYEITVTRQVRVPSGDSTISVSTVTAEDTDMNSIGVLSEIVRFREIKTGEAELEPVILIPGIAASRLEVAGIEAWPAVGNTSIKDLLDLSQSPAPTVIARDIIRTVAGKPVDIPVYEPLIQAFNMLGYVEYNPALDPDLRTTAGCDTSQTGANLFIFPYDWRDTNIANANRLNDYIGCIRQLYAEDVRLNIVAHSMGGLVARRYMLDQHDEISKLITIGTPWLGAPKAIHVMGTGDFFDGPVWQRLLQQLLVIGPDRLRRLVEYFDGVHELLPSLQYFKLAGQDSVHPFPFENRNIQNTGLPPPPVFGSPPSPSPSQDRDNCSLTPPLCAYNDFARVFDLGLFPRSAPVRSGRFFHGLEQDDWTSDPVGAAYYNVFGNGKLTISKVATTEHVLPHARYSNELALRTNATSGLNSGQIPIAGGSQPVRWVSTLGFDTEMGTGDGTVPRLSAIRINTANENLNAPTAELKEFVANSGGAVEQNIEHTGLTQYDQVHNYIGCVLAPWLFDTGTCTPTQGVPAR